MTPPALAEATYIDSERELNQLVDSLRRERRIACAL